VTLLMIPGVSADQKEFLNSGRPEQVRIRLTTSTSEEKVTKVWDLDDQAGQQTVGIGVDDVEKVELSVLSSNGTEDGARVAIAEVEFLTRG